MHNFVFRSLPLNRDSRTVRYKELLQSNNVTFNTWEDSYQHNKSGLEKVKLGRLSVSKIVSYPLYLTYLFLYSLLKVRKGDRVICMDLDTFIPVFCASFYKGAVIYLDIVDPIGQTKFSRFPFPKLFDYLEYFSLRFRKFNILPNDNRASYYQDRIAKDISKVKYLLVENVPISFSDNLVEESVDNLFDIGYFGTLDSARGLDELLEFAEKYKLRVLFAGMGKLESKIKEISITSKYVSFHGAFSSNDLFSLYSQVKFTWAFYTSDIELHRYASPNKFYEHLAYNTPIITNKIVPMSTIVRDFNTGIILDDHFDSNSFERLYCELKSFNFNSADYSLWSCKYRNYSVDFNSYESYRLV